MKLLVLPLLLSSSLAIGAPCAGRPSGYPTGVPLVGCPRVAPAICSPCLQHMSNHTLVYEGTDDMLPHWKLTLERAGWTVKANATSFNATKGSDSIGGSFTTDKNQTVRLTVVMKP